MPFPGVTNIILISIMVIQRKLKVYVPGIIDGFCMIERDCRKRAERLTDIEEKNS